MQITPAMESTKYDSRISQHSFRMCSKSGSCQVKMSNIVRSGRAVLCTWEVKLELERNQNFRVPLL